MEKRETANIQLVVSEEALVALQMNSHSSVSRINTGLTQGGNLLLPLWVQIIKHVVFLEAAQFVMSQLVLISRQNLQRHHW